MGQGGQSVHNPRLLFALHRTLSIRYLTRRWTRSLLIVLSIALGVATLVATRLLNTSLVKATEQVLNPLAAADDLVVVNGQTGMSIRLAEEMRAAHVPHVKSISPLIVGRVTLTEL